MDGIWRSILLASCRKSAILCILSKKTELHIQLRMVLLIKDILSLLIQWEITAALQKDLVIASVANAQKKTNEAATDVSLTF
mgnify:CR=1 FL=1